MVLAGALEDCNSNCNTEYPSATNPESNASCKRDCDCLYKQGVICIQNPLKYQTIGEMIPAITDFLKNIAIAIGGIMIVWSGIQIMVGMTTGEKEAKVIKGKKTLMWTVVGIAVVISIDFIVGFIKELIGG